MKHGGHGGLQTSPGKPGLLNPLPFESFAVGTLVPLNSTKASKGQMVSDGMRWHQMVEVWNEMSLLLANTVLPERLHIRPGQFWPQWDGAPKALSFSAYNIYNFWQRIWQQGEKPCQLEKKKSNMS